MKFIPTITSLATLGSLAILGNSLADTSPLNNLEKRQTDLTISQARCKSFNRGCSLASGALCGANTVFEYACSEFIAAMFVVSRPLVSELRQVVLRRMRPQLCFAFPTSTSTSVPTTATGLQNAAFNASTFHDADYSYGSAGEGVDEGVCKVGGDGRVGSFGEVGGSWGSVTILAQCAHCCSEGKGVGEIGGFRRVVGFGEVGILGGAGAKVGA
ncbi:MAG: hypothetical protein J3R72DRAFT_495343 [Linnemannia gamsii]|nr:MAG: hypothetical protein J3R72DRAFT_495343 [Linnemannia gamsii]